MEFPSGESKRLSDHAAMLKKLHDQHAEILHGFSHVLESHGIRGVDVSQFGFMLKSGAPLCPNGTPAVFRCALGANGEYQCKWVCEP